MYNSRRISKHAQWRAIHLLASRRCGVPCSKFNANVSLSVGEEILFGDVPPLFPLSTPPPRTAHSTLALADRAHRTGRKDALAIALSTLRKPEY